MNTHFSKILLISITLLIIIGIGLTVFKPRNTNQLTSNTSLEKSTSTRIAIVSDIDRCASREFATQKNLLRFVDFANTQQVDVAVSLGDNIAHRLGECSKTAQGDLHFVMEILSSLSMPMHYVLGDHDISDDPETYTLWLEKTTKDTTYYSFDHGDVHIIILDTVTGGNSPLMCKDDKNCNKYLAEKESLEAELAEKGFSHAQGKIVDMPLPTGQTERSTEFKKFKKNRGNEIVSRIVTIENIKKIHNLNAQFIRDDLVRDNGLLGKEQLLWLSHDLATTDKEKILLLADHPLLHYTTNKKSYQINDLEALTQILTDAKKANPKKKFVAVFGETHTWHKALENDITYYGVNQFRDKDGSWALFSWDETFSLHKVRDDQIGEEVQ